MIRREETYTDDDDSHGGDIESNAIWNIYSIQKDFDWKVLFYVHM